MESGWELTKADRAAARELQARLPERVFDVHLHLYEKNHVRPQPLVVKWGPSRAGTREWRNHVGRQVGRRRLIGALCTPFPSKNGNLQEANSFVIANASRQRNCLANVIVSPSQSSKEVEDLIKANPKVVGLKQYHLLAPGTGTFQARLTDYMPEWAWKLADEYSLVILLHLVRDRALADRRNQDDLRRLCHAYGNARVILAHAARGFHPRNTIAGIRAIQDIDNILFDTSGICESSAIAALLDTFGPRRILWGSDFPISQQRGRCVGLGDGFAWITTDQVAWNRRAFFGSPIAAGLEALYAVLDACDRLGLGKEDLDLIFCLNAMRLLGLEHATGNETQALYEKAKTIIPGGTQLLSKRPEMAAPEQWPAYFSEARGCEVWDIDGRHYYDCSFHGIGATLLGFRDPDVTRAVVRRVNLGACSTLNPPEEVRLAERLLDIHPWADQARFARTGGEAMAVAVRIARATTDRSAVAICGYHGWHDWYLAANLGDHDALRGHLLPGLSPIGVPGELRGTSFPFTYNNRDHLLDIVREHGGRLAAIVMEPCRHHDPDPGFLEFVRETAHKAGALLIFDEITIGWRLTYGGSHLRFRVNPDIAVFGKTLANGHPMAAVIGTTPAMEGAHISFISSSYWTEGVGPAAALATIDKMANIDLPAHCERIGRRVQDAWREAGARHDIPVREDDGYPALAHFTFDHELADALKTLYTQLMLERGFLAVSSIYVTLAHTDRIIDLFVDAIDDVFEKLGLILQTGKILEHLKGPVAHSGFRRLL